MEGGRYRRVSEDSAILNEAFSIYRLGHKDMIDNILYASSTQLNLKLLTLDRELKKFIHAKRLRDTLVSPDQLASTSSASKS
jgi:PIN domain nuclease of toxin-antitoxin system